MKTEKVKKFLEFQSQFSKREWNELLNQIEIQYRKKANELQLTDLDIEEIVTRHF